MRVGFLGIGAMGSGMAGNLLKAGYDVTVFNRTQSRSRILEASGASVATSATKACEDAEIIISMLADDTATEAVFLENPSFLQSLLPNVVHCCMATISVELGARLDKLHRKQGHIYISAPVFGRPPASEAGELFIIAAGKQKALSFCQPLFDVMGQRTFAISEDPPLANIVKIAGNFMLASLIETLGEAFALTRKHDVNPETFLEVLTNSLFPVPAYRNYGAMIARNTYDPPGFKLALGLKDVELALDAARKETVPMPIASLCRDRFLSAIARGYRDQDWAAIGRISAEDAGITD